MRWSTRIAVVFVTLVGSLGLPTTAIGGKERSSTAISDFKQSNPCPSTGRMYGRCPGYQIDHRHPLAAGGADRPSNMQWLSTRQHRAKTANERRNSSFSQSSGSMRP